MPSTKLTKCQKRLVVLAKGRPSLPIRLSNPIFIKSQSVFEPFASLTTQWKIRRRQGRGLPDLTAYIFEQLYSRRNVKHSEICFDALPACEQISPNLTFDKSVM